MRWLLLALAAGFLLPSAATAADGDPCPTAIKRFHKYAGCVYLIDSGSTDATGSEVFLDIKKNIKQMTFEVSAKVGCSAGTVTVTHFSSAGAAIKHAFDSTVDLTLSSTGITAFTLDAAHAMPLQYVQGTIAGGAGPCTDVDVLVHWK